MSSLARRKASHKFASPTSETKLVRPSANKVRVREPATRKIPIARTIATKEYGGVGVCVARPTQAFWGV